ncbi:superfamily II DNA/RNA helicase [Nitrospirillum amazonense]|uniref:DEAD-box ATP-dependent RNA helicase RhpA n=1 Tax=Nitrospirillum amazonense TaxID=28077 RepID=A0A560F532_9PROT|nr:DEAD/DEAH box helicase [Nitrospirillum amazonense]TWB16752.1 superfamily II DNA/RNA helicase [Nitrospirillum amazonense]
MLFSEIGLGPEVLRAVEDAGYSQPTPIQEKAIPWVLQGRDVLGCAQTGTGKTASFTLPMIDILASGRARARMPRSLILEPTRELAAQVAENFEVYGKYHKLNMALLIGGESFGDQIKKLERGVDVLIATPGRMMDLFDRGNILLSDIKILVIDEADRMLDMGFIPDIERIVGLLPKMRQTLFFSATMPPEIRRLADAFLMNPREITVAPPASPAATVTQAVAMVRGEDKREALRHLLRTEDVKNAFIFCNRKRDVALLHQSLTRHGFNAGALHGDMVQSKRTETLEQFRQGEIALLCCSDVAARGIDIAGVSHVFNFDVPHHADDYVHRIGRTGRAGKSGRAFMLATPDDSRTLGAIEKLIGREIPRIMIDGLETPDMSEGESEGGRRRRSSRSDSAAKGGSRRRGSSRGDAAPEAPREAQAEAAPVAEEAVEARRPERQERPERSERQERPERGGRDRNRNRDNRGEAREGGRSEGGRADARPPRQDDRGEPRRRWRDEDDGPTVVGFGDDVPAFMLRVARPVARAVPPETFDGSDTPEA